MLQRREVDILSIPHEEIKSPWENFFSNDTFIFDTYRIWPLKNIQFLKENTLEYSHMTIFIDQILLMLKDVSVSNLIIVKLSKVFTATYGVKNFYDGVKNFWHRPLFLPCGTYEQKKSYDLDLKIPIFLKWHLTTNTSFFPSLQKFFTPLTFVKKSFPTLHTTTPFLRSSWCPSW